MREKNSGNKLVILTVDLEEWFHILDIDFIADPNKWGVLEVRIFDNTYRILDILKGREIKATFFVLGWIAKKYPDLIRYISDQGHEIGTHSQNHILIYKSNPQLFRNDIIESIDTIQSIINKKVVAFRAPGFSIKRDSLWALRILSEIGVLFDSSIFPATRTHGGIKDFQISQPFLFNIGGTLIKEFPINVYKVGLVKIPFSGGGYFRLLPFNIFKYFTNKSNYIMTYFHPRDFDPNQPIIKEIPALRKITYYYGLNNSLCKFTKMIDQFKFINLSTADNLIDWDNAPIINID
jgi:polysaccharide deacetylase family protein (PEP-CTERM system associated)